MLDKTGFHFAKATYQAGIDTAAVSWMLLWLVIRSLGLRPARVKRGAAPSFPPLRMILGFGRVTCARPLVCNPRFLEAMMGWPIGWSAPGCSVTGFAPWLRRQRTALSMLR